MLLYSSDHKRELSAATSRCRPCRRQHVSHAVSPVKVTASAGGNTVWCCDPHSRLTRRPLQRRHLVVNVCRSNQMKTVRLEELTVYVGLIQSVRFIYGSHAAVVHVGGSALVQACRDLWAASGLRLHTTRPRPGASPPRSPDQTGHRSCREVVQLRIVFLQAEEAFRGRTRTHTHSVGQQNTNSDRRTL